MGNEPNKQGTNIENLHLNIGNPKSKGLELDEKQSKRHYVIEQDGSIKFNFSHHNQLYDKTTKSIENFKNLLKLETPMELKALIFKIDKFKSSAKTNEFTAELDALISNTKNDFDEFYSAFKNMFQINKKLYLNCQKYIDNWLSGEDNQTVNMVEETTKESNTTKEIVDLSNSFHKFKNEFASIQKIMKLLKIEDVKMLENVDQLSEFLKNNQDELKNTFSFESPEQCRSFIISLGQLKTFIGAKLDLIDKFVDVVNNLNTLYCEVIKNLNSAPDSFDIMGELNEYYHLMIKHRYIRHIEVKIREIEDLVNNSKNII